MSWKASMAQRQGANIGDHSGQTASETRAVAPETLHTQAVAAIAAPLVTLVPAARTIAPYRAAFAVVLLSLSRTAI